MKKSIKSLLILISLFGLTNCSATYFSLTPDEESSYEMGRKVIEKEDDNAFSSITFEGQSENLFDFYFYAKIKDQENFLFDPKFIYAKAYDENKKVISNSKRFAIDPEDQIANLDQEKNERDNSHDTFTGLNILFSLFNTVADLTDDEDNDAEEVAENILIFTGNQINEEVSYQNDLNHLKDQKYYWNNEVLRKTDLSNDEEISGIIHIPIIKEASFIKIYFPLGETIHTYKFQQTIQ